MLSHAIGNEARFLDSDSEIDNSDEETARIRSKASGKVVSIRKIRTSGLCVGEMKKSITSVADLIRRLGVPISSAAGKRERRRSNPPAPADKPKPQMITYVEEQQEPPAVLCGGARVFVSTFK